MELEWRVNHRRQLRYRCGLRGFARDVLEVRRLDVVIARSARFDAARVEGDVAAAGVEGDFFLRRNTDFVFAADDVQPVASKQFQLVVLRLHAHRALVGDQLDAQLAHEQAQPLAHAHEQALDHTDVGFATGVEHQVVLCGQLQVVAAAQGDALWGAEQQHRGLELLQVLAQQLHLRGHVGGFGGGGLGIRRELLQLFAGLLQASCGGGHIEHRPLRFGLPVSTDKHTLAAANTPPPIGAQLKAFATFFALGIHQMTQIELAFATVLGTELDVLLPSRVIHAQLVIGRGAQHVAFVVTQAHVVNVLAVVQRMGDVGPIRVALFEGYGHFGAGDQRQVQAMSVTGIGSGQA
ncbi:Unknown protein sequence [Pseudomonas amygdali]|nr:Unknown protein sequence [Pseudomonas amygdali]